MSNFHFAILLLENAFPALLEFAALAQKTFAYTQLSIVDVLPEDEIQKRTVTQDFIPF